MVHVYREDSFLIVEFKDWDVSDIGRYCEGFLAELDKSNTPLLPILVALNNPQKMNVIEATRAFKDEIVRIFHHPNFIHPLAMVLTPEMLNMFKIAKHFPWVKIHDFILADSLEEAKSKLLAIRANDKNL